MNFILESFFTYLLVQSINKTDNRENDLYWCEWKVPRTPPPKKNKFILAEKTWMIIFVVEMINELLRTNLGDYP